MSNSGISSGLGSSSNVPDLSKVKPVTEERRLELLALARTTRITWILEGIDKGSVLETKRKAADSQVESSVKIPISNILQQSFNYFTDVIGDQEYVNIDSFIPLASLDEFDMNMNEEQYIKYVDEENPYAVFLNQLCQTSACDVVKSMQQFVLKCKSNISTKVSNSLNSNNANSSPLCVSSIESFLSRIHAQMATNPLWKIEMLEQPNSGTNNYCKHQMEKLKEHTEKFVHVKLYDIIRNHVDNITHDRQLLSKILTLNFITAEHLDIKANPGTNPNQTWSKLLEGPNQYLLQISSKKCPNDKMDCIKQWMAAVTVVMQQVANETSLQQAPPGADDYLSLLILSIQKCCQIAAVHREQQAASETSKSGKPEKYEDFLHLYSTQMYLQTYLSPQKLNGEAGYLLTQFVSAVHFLETADATSLTISPEEFHMAVANSKKHSASVMSATKLNINQKVGGSIATDVKAESIWTDGSRRDVQVTEAELDSICLQLGETTCKSNGIRDQPGNKRNSLLSKYRRLSGSVL